MEGAARVGENTCVLLKARPVGVPGPEFFDVVTRPVAALQDGQFLVHNAYLSVDPAMRGWVNEAANYIPEGHHVHGAEPRREAGGRALLAQSVRSAREVWR